MVNLHYFSEDLENFISFFESICEILEKTVSTDDESKYSKYPNTSIKFKLKKGMPSMAIFINSDEDSKFVQPPLDSTKEIVISKAIFVNPEEEFTISWENVNSGFSLTYSITSPSMGEIYRAPKGDLLRNTARMEMAFFDSSIATVTHNSITMPFIIVAQTDTINRLTPMFLDDECDVSSVKFGELTTTGTIDISDIGLNKLESGSLWDTQIKPGTYCGLAEVCRALSPWTTHISAETRISSLTIYNKELFPNVDPNKNYYNNFSIKSFELLGHICVDRGKAGFFVEKPVINWNDYKSSEVEDYWRRENMAGIEVDNYHSADSYYKSLYCLDNAIYSNSGYGDGYYPVITNKDRTVFKIIFIEDLEPKRIQKLIGYEED